MKYDITKSSSPKMPELGRGTECLKLLLSQTSKDMNEPLVPIFFPILGEHISGAEFLYPDKSWKEPCGMMANLVAESGGNKGHLSNLVEAVCRDFRRHDEAELQKLVAWQRQISQMLRNIYDRHASLLFNLRKNTYRCFVCGVHGGPIDLVMRCLHKDFKEACSWLVGEGSEVAYRISPQLPSTCSPTATKPASGSSSSCRSCCPTSSTTSCPKGAKTSSTIILISSQYRPNIVPILSHRRWERVKS